MKKLPHHLFCFLLLLTVSAAFAQVKTKDLKVIMQFTENPRTHNLHVACDGKNYYTINGGVASSGQICKYTLQGKLLETYPVNIDGRGFTYNQADGHFYVSTYIGDVVRFDDITKGKYTTLYNAIMQDGQCTFDLSADGTQFYDFTNGTLKIHDLATGKVVQTLTGFKYGSETHSGANAIAADSKHFYTWDSYAGTIWQYDMTGNLKTIFHIPHGQFGHSLSVCNGYIFTADDGNYSDGTWYQYLIPKESNLPVVVNFEITPIANNYAVSGTVDSVHVVNSSGKIVFSADSSDAQIINNQRLFQLYLLGLPEGEYQVLIFDINADITSKAIKVD